MKHIRWVIIFSALLVGLSAVRALAAVTVVDFAAEAQPNQIVLSWSTANEFNNLGFNLLRSTSQSSGYIQINAQLIPSRCLGCPSGFDYTYTDRNVVAGPTYFYKLQSVENTGAKETFGPISTSLAAPNPTATATPRNTPLPTATATGTATALPSTATPAPSATPLPPNTPTATATLLVGTPTATLRVTPTMTADATVTMNTPASAAPIASPTASLTPTSVSPARPPIAGVSPTATIATPTDAPTVTTDAATPTATATTSAIALRQPTRDTQSPRAPENVPMERGTTNNNANNAPFIAVGLATVFGIAGLAALALAAFALILYARR